MLYEFYFTTPKRRVTRYLLPRGIIGPKGQNLLLKKAKLLNYLNCVKVSYICAPNSQFH